jgi:rhamnulokinase
MSSARKLFAFDLGAESGRGILGLFDGGRLSLEVVHRFPNGPVRTLETIHWDVLRLYGEMVNALLLCAGTVGGIDSVGIDTWGVDFALLGSEGTLLGNPRHYRDPHTEGVMDLAFQRVGKAEIFRQTGLQFMRFNTLFQLIALVRDRSPLLAAAKHLLFIPDLFHYWFTGIKLNELTDASTSQMLDPATGSWAYPLVQSFGLPVGLLGTIVKPGTVLGPLRTSVATETGLVPMPVVAVATHDTASAVAAVPASSEENWAYISSGTWSLMGVELPSPRVGEAALAANFTNEIGFGGTVRFLKNIMGLWLVQECRRIWERAGQSHSYDELMRLAAEAPAFACMVDPDDASFILPASMPQALADYCRRTGQPAPAGVGATVRCALESLALRYRWAAEKLEELTQRKLSVIHIVGGGCQNELLCQLTADACNRLVLAGPVEATALGNIVVQAIGLGLLGSLAEGRELVRRSFEVKHYEPRHQAAWDEAYERFKRLLAG